MDHERATTLIVDHARGRLEPALAADMERHLRECEKCRQASEASSALEAQIRSRGPEYLAAHPPADDVAAYAVFPDSLPQSRLAAVALHVRACPLCEAEASIARRSLSGAWWRGWRASMFGIERQPQRALLASALAVMTVALLYPAYLGTVRYPAALRERDRATVTADSLRGVQGQGMIPREAVETASPLTPFEGSVGSLVLAGPSRAMRPATPTVHRRADQRFVHVVIDDPVAAEARASGGHVDVTIVRVGDPIPVWHLEASAAGIWDEGLQAAGFVIPADRLSRGSYRLELRLGPGAPAFIAAFRVIEAGP